MKCRYLVLLLFLFCNLLYGQRDLGYRAWSRVVNEQPAEWYGSEEAIRIAENVLLYQRNVGGWPKNTPMHQLLSEEEEAEVLAKKSSNRDATTDNGATILELVYLSKVHRETREDRYKTAFLKGVDYLLEAQYPNGGWPQFYPLHEDYSRHITFNDGAMVNIMRVMQGLWQQDEPFIRVDAAIRERARAAYDKGIELILKTQYRQDGELTVWCAQHDAHSLEPVGARTYELASLSGKESAGIVLLLMEVEDPSPEVIRAVGSAVRWFRKNQIRGIRVEYYTNEEGMRDKRVLEDENAPPLWGRFYGLEDNVPYFCDRDGIKKYRLEEIGHERRVGYGWHTDAPAEVLEKYSEWRKARTTIFTIGDSTMSDKKPEGYPETGWCQVLGDYLEGIYVENHARNGRSSKSFIAEGRWQAVLDRIQPGDYVFIQFGHNDQKEYDTTRYTTPFGTYSRNLERFVKESRERGAEPVLFTSIVRRRFGEDGRLVDTHGDYPAAMREVAVHMEVPLVDLQKLTENWVNGLGDVPSREMYLWLAPCKNYPEGREDDTHLSEKGARNIVKMALAECVSLQLGFAGQVRGLEEASLMDWKTEYSVRIHLLQQMHAQYAARDLALEEALKSRKKMQAYQQERRQRYLSILGELPEKKALNPILSGSIEKDGFRVERVLFESLPGHHITASFYLPEGEGPFPAALIFCGHEMVSKATASYQRIASLFAQNGFAALLVDPVSQGERVQFTDEDHLRILRGSTTEHTLLNAGANLVGSGVVAHELNDNVRAMDYLLSRPEVDPERIGCLGNSGGGTQTTYFMAYDERVKVAAPCSYVASRERNFVLFGANDGCQHIPFEGREQLEIADFMAMFAPKPALILAGRYDFVDYTGTKEAFGELQQVYEVLGEPGQVSLFTADDGHGISRPKREAVVQWFRRFLCDDSSHVTESYSSVLSEQALNCTPDGQVNGMFPDEVNVQQLNLRRARELKSARQEFSAAHELEGYRVQVRELLAIDEGVKAINPERLGTDWRSDYRIEKYILRVEDEVPLPCLVFVPELRQAVSPAVICAMEEGKYDFEGRDSLITAHMKKGNILLMADLRGMGESSDKKEANEWKYYNREYHNAMLCLHLGLPMPGQRTRDLLTLIDFSLDLSPEGSGAVHLIASGAVGPPAIYAALFRKQLTSVRIHRSIRSYFEILERPLDLDWYSYVIPHVLEYFDLPDLEALRDDLVISNVGMKPSACDAYHSSQGKH